MDRYPVLRAIADAPMPPRLSAIDEIRWVLRRRDARALLALANPKEK